MLLPTLIKNDYIILLVLADQLMVLHQTYATLSNLTVKWCYSFTGLLGYRKLTINIYKHFRHIFFRQSSALASATKHQYKKITSKTKLFFIFLLYRVR